MSVQIPDIGTEAFGLLVGQFTRENRQTRRAIACIDATGAVAQEVTLTVTSPTAIPYILTFADATPVNQGGSGASIAVSFTSATTDATVFVTTLKALLETSYPALGALIDFATMVQAAGVLTFSALPGVTMTVTDTLDTNTDIAVGGTAASAAPQYLYGQAVDVLAPASTFSPYLGQQNRCQSPAAVAGTVLTTTMTYSSTGNASMTVMVSPYPGAPFVSYMNGWAMGANLAASVANLAAEWLLTITGVDVPVVTTSTGVVTATFPPGVTAFLVTETTASGTVATVATDAVALPICGTVYRTNDESPNFTYPGPGVVTGPLLGGTIPVWMPSPGGEILVARPSGGVTYGARVWHGTTSTEDGYYFAAGGPTRVPDPQLVWVGNDPNNSANAVLGVR